MSDITPEEIERAIDLLVAQGRVVRKIVNGKPGVQLVGKPDAAMERLLDRYGQSD